MGGSSKLDKLKAMQKEGKNPGVPLCGDGLPSLKRVVSGNDGRGCFFYRFWGRF